jgi:hypothetical protein
MTYLLKTIKSTIDSSRQHIIHDDIIHDDDA